MIVVQRKVVQNISRQKRSQIMKNCSEYFKKIRSYFKDLPEAVNIVANNRSISSDLKTNEKKLLNAI